MSRPLPPLALLLLFLLLLASASGAAEVVHDTLVRERQHQVMEHFGASDCWTMKSLDWDAERKERLARLLFSPDEGIGLSQWRFNIGAGSTAASISNPWRRVECFASAEGVYDWSRQAAERWFLRAAKRFGVPSLVAFVNSPPVFLTRNGLGNCLGLTGSCNLRPGAEPAFARFLGDVLEHFARHPEAAERIVFDRVSPINEPEWPWDERKQEGMRASLPDITAIARAVARELARRASPTRLLLVESGDTRFLSGGGRNYLAAFARDAELSAALGGVLCYHSYWSDTPERLIPSRQQLARAAGAYPGLRLWQSEYCIMAGGRALDMDGALPMARVLHHDLVDAGASSWCWWTAVSTEKYQDGLIYSDWKNPGDEAGVLLSKRFWTLGHWSRFVRPGYRRLGIEAEAGDGSGLLRSAFAGDSGRLVMVYINPAFRELALELAGTLPGGACASFTTSDAPGDDLRRTVQAPGTRRFTLPSRSVTTLLWER